SAHRRRLRPPHLYRPRGHRRHAGRPCGARDRRRRVPGGAAAADRSAAVIEPLTPPQPSALPDPEEVAEGANMNQAFICDAVRTPFGRYGGALASIRTDDL